MAIKSFWKIFKNKEELKGNNESNFKFDFDGILGKIANLLKLTGNSWLAAIIFKGMKKCLKFEDCMCEHALTLKTNEERFDLYLENADFFHEMMLSEKAKYYYQIVFESSDIDLKRLNAKKKFHQIVKMANDPYHKETIALEKID